MDYFLYNRYLGSAPDVSGCGIVYICPKCGEVWGRIHIKGQLFHNLTRGCPRCGPAWMLDEAGCLTISGDWQRLPATNLSKQTPFDVLLNEFNQLEKLA